MISKSLRSACLAAGLVLAASAHAGLPPSIVSSIDWTGFSVQLVDLDPGDGVSAEFSWIATGSDVQAQDGAVAVSGSAPDHTTPIPAIAGVAVAVANKSELRVALGDPAATAGAYGDSRRGYTFELPANTLAIFSVIGTGSVGNLGEFTQGDAFGAMIVEGPNADGGDGPAQNSRGVYRAFRPPGSFGVPSDTQEMLALFANRTGNSLSGSLSFLAVASLSNAARVPEPGTYVMILGGLGMLALVLMMRRKP